MIIGLNQNFLYKGEAYHVQTEDGGKANPVITTVLFKGGTVVASRRTNYLDMLKSEKLEETVRHLIRDQHASLLRELKDGRLDEEIKKIQEKRVD